ncbi:DUF2786 domain-containing protein [Aeromicrobium stalagmiti]|uniref:DUF2786 domain-containing protein n=1 Tax=Aeromicrobium stalagmiti TaxID=2738988 RepID=UPI001568619E|nr:DUF2786 domain-containing protein [Aeromicrobium stalagmiti]NRQ50803.1 DUF2786 domain-containing protein [Aeromicrobium stalagmiti]
MGQDSRRRRDARRQAHPRSARVAPPATGRTALSRAEIMTLVEVAVRHALVSAQVAGPRIATLNDIGAAADDPALDPARLVVDEVLARIGAAWEHGWQPLELVHATRRRTSAPAARWIAQAVLIEADRSAAERRAPQAWVEQLRIVASRHGALEGADDLLALRGQASTADWVAALTVLDLVRRLPRSQLLMPPPSGWGRPHRVASSSPRPTGAQAKTLTRVRALLAKAESTEFTAEAEAFTAKAQDLMTRHSIDEALLADEAGESLVVQGVRVLIHHPYAMEKAGLLDVVARANRTRAVWNDFASCMTIVGVPTDLVQVEMLFTSTLVQATTAMTHAGQVPGRSGPDRSTAFRKAFLTAYASRIGERLTASTDEAVADYGGGLLPVLRRQAAAIDEEFERLFPHVTTGSRRTRFDARGWEEGLRAADAAVLPSGMVES